MSFFRLISANLLKKRRRSSTDFSLCLLIPIASKTTGHRLKSMLLRALTPQLLSFLVFAVCFVLQTLAVQSVAELCV